MKPIDLRAVSAFLVVVEEQSITRAAARLFVAQQTLSEQIRKLERALGVVLLVRNPRGVLVTEAGRELAAYGAGLSTELEMLVERLRAVARDESQSAA
jgi:LysR family nitrogen assimilation transcriptional regulator